MTKQRRHDIDWLRVLAIGLLLIYHIAIIFQPWAMMIGFIRSDEPLSGLWKAMSLVNVWRIPLLFYISGMGLYFAMQERNLWQLLTERTRRILVPFIFGIIAIAPLHLLIFQKYYHFPLSYYPHTGHLWFLGNIFAYVLLLSPLFFFLMRNQNGRFKKVLSTIMQHPFGPLLIAVFFVLEALLVRPQLYTLYANTWHGFFIGLLAFAFGFIAVYSGSSFWQTISKWKWFYLSLATGLFTIRLLIFNTASPAYLMAVESTCWILSIFGLGYRYLNQPGTILSYLSQAAYPVYIIHMLALFGGAYFILPLSIPPMLKFVSISAFTFAFCYGVYEYLIRRVNFIRPFFGLKPVLKSAKKNIRILN